MNILLQQISKIKAGSTKSGIAWVSFFNDGLEIVVYMPIDKAFAIQRIANDYLPSIAKKHIPTSLNVMSVESVAVIHFDTFHVVSVTDDKGSIAKFSFTDKNMALEIYEAFK